MIKNLNPPSSLMITDLGFNFPWASVLLVLKLVEVQYKNDKIAIINIYYIYDALSTWGEFYLYLYVHLQLSLHFDLCFHTWHYFYLFVHHYRYDNLYYYLHHGDYDQKCFWQVVRMNARGFLLM